VQNQKSNARRGNAVVKNIYGLQGAMTT